MPLNVYLDDVIYDGEQTDFERLALAASVYAVTVLGLEARIVGDPPVYYPNSTSPLVLAEFLRIYRDAFDKIRADIEDGEGEN